jgi:hypothetical protein
LETSTFYNVLGGVTDINLGGPGVLKTTFGYYGTEGPASAWTPPASITTGRGIMMLI